MSMYKCPVCGELFSTSYKKCPFCEEDDLMRDRRKRANHHQGGRRRRNEPRAVGPILIVIFLLLVALVVYVLAGDKLFGGQDPAAGENEPPVTSTVDGEGEDGQDGAATVPLALDRSDAELEVGGTVTLTASDGTGTYTWSTSDASIATVTEGVVQAVGEGSAAITVTDGETTATCVVTVKSVPLTLSTNDVSIAVDESFTLKAEGGSSFTFTSDDESVAVVNADGVVTGKAKGRANITVSNGSSTATCIVRVVR